MAEPGQREPCGQRPYVALHSLQGNLQCGPAPPPHEMPTALSLSRMCAAGERGDKGRAACCSHVGMVRVAGRGSTAAMDWCEHEREGEGSQLPLARSRGPIPLRQAPGLGLGLGLDIGVRVLVGAWQGRVEMHAVRHIHILQGLSRTLCPPRSPAGP